MNEKNNDSSAVSFAYVESTPGHALLGKKKTSRPAPQTRIHIHSRRKRLADPDGISAKYVIDAIVKTGIIKDDSPAFVRKISYSQEKSDEEKTIITIFQGGSK